MSSADSVQILDAPFLNTDYLQVLGRDGFIMMIVAVFLCGILVILTIALIAWHCCCGCKTEKAGFDYSSRSPESPQKGAEQLPSPSPLLYVDSPNSGSPMGAALAQQDTYDHLSH